MGGDEDTFLREWTQMNKSRTMSYCSTFGLLVTVRGSINSFGWGRPWGAQRLRICLLLQGTQVQSLVQEDSTYHWAAKPMCHNYGACTLEPVRRNKRSHHNEKPAHPHCST